MFIRKGDGSERSLFFFVDTNSFCSLLLTLINKFHLFNSIADTQNSELFAFPLCLASLCVIHLFLCCLHSLCKAFYNLFRRKVSFSMDIHNHSFFLSFFFSFSFSSGRFGRVSNLMPSFSRLEFTQSKFIGNVPSFFFFFFLFSHPHCSIRHATGFL